MPAERLFLVSFSVKIRHRDQVTLIDVSGHLTFFEVGALRESIQTLLNAQRKNIVLNLSELMYLDSSGIGELARIYVAVGQARWGNEGDRSDCEGRRNPQNHSFISGVPGIPRRTICFAEFPRIALSTSQLSF